MRVGVTGRGKLPHNKEHLIALNTRGIPATQPAREYCSSLAKLTGPAHVGTLLENAFGKGSGGSLSWAETRS
jgi:hypothetical protein